MNRLLVTTAILFFISTISFGQLTYRDMAEDKIRELSKEIDRWKTKAEERDDYRLGKKNELREEI